MCRHYLKRFILQFILATALFLRPQFASAGDSYLDQARIAFRAGQYEQAVVKYLKAADDDKAEGVIGAARAWMQIGKYADAESVCRRFLTEAPGAFDVAVQLSEILTITGRSDEALRVLDPVIKDPVPPLRGLVQYGKLLVLHGRRETAAGYFARAVDLYNDGWVTSAEDLAMAAVACWRLRSYHDANRLFQEALRVDSDHPEAQVLWGDLFLEKYNTAEAHVSFSRVLKQNPKYVPALVGLAKASNGHAAQAILDEALSVNPQSLSALEAFAEILIEDDRYENAAGYVDRILKINPESIEAKTLAAALAYLRDDAETYGKIRSDVEAFSPGNAGFYARIASVCGRKYRFTEAVTLARRAVEIDPEDENGYTLLGANLLRLGKEDEGRAYLEAGFKKDPFNYWTLNLLKVLETMDRFETRTIGPFIVRMDADDTAVLWPYLAPLLTESWNTQIARYGFVPERPLLIEVFPDHSDFSARTSGLPDIGPLVGVCFGRVITLDSPRAFKPPGGINWQEVVWHEFAHVGTLQMTRNRIPRWLTEGISVFEERCGRPQWGRKQDLDLIRAVQENRMLPLERLNEGFSNAESVEDINFAYYQSFLVVSYVVEKYGFDTLRRLIFAYGDTEDMAAIFLEVFDTPLNKFEEGFSAWLKQRVQELDVYIHPDDLRHTPKHYGTQAYGSEKEPYVNEADLRRRIDENPRDFFAHLYLGITLYNDKDYAGAVYYLITARDMLPEYAAVPNPRQILADIYKERGDESAMVRELEALADIQQHAVEPCLILAQTAFKKRDYGKAVKYLERAIAVNPYDLTVHRRLAEAAMRQSDYERAVREFTVLVALDSTDPAGAHTDLAGALLQAGQKGAAKESALAALEIAPMYERAQEILLDALEP